MAHAEGQQHPAAGQQHSAAGGQDHIEGQQHPLGIYFKIWGLLFVLSAASSAVDYFHIQGYLRWFLILTFMMLKAGLYYVFCACLERLAVCMILGYPAAARTQVSARDCIRAGRNYSGITAFRRKGRAPRASAESVGVRKKVAGWCFARQKRS
jgi:cytochrome c oxidase subunit IV